ncbi:alanine--tRNA ligase [bacterium]|nr:MAG: alanine--tRNA ligase [bacterium]QQR62130.1 MAG: alanine--tRNA ligase [bacterium]QQR63312.1 MAG: alanine--tRNA ligase [bacterium]
MNSQDVRKKFFAFFEKQKHAQVESSSLIPAGDNSILFANAGMNQFKDLFLGVEKRSYSRAVTIQKCVRAGGKHNDLDNVGFTKRHLTFFEMMGNFSFADYFKKDAIIFAWDFLTKELGLPTDKLSVTVFETDDEAFDIWHTVIGVPKGKIYRLGAETNFWQMGDVGPCGPCTEIFIDRGSLYGGPEESPATSSERFLEIWNLVFMQYDRQQDGSLKPLKATGVDTGMGLERLTLIVQNKDSVYETDLFAAIIQEIVYLTSQSYIDKTDELKAAFHVLADHIRSSTFLIAAGCAPSNEGRGYVLRKIIRRAALFSLKLTEKNIFPELSKVVVKQFGQIYPELVDQQEVIFTTLYHEIEKFSVNLMRGNALLEGLFASNKNKIISGTDAFKLYDTYGFPFEITVAAAAQKGFSVDSGQFEKEMETQKNRSGSKVFDMYEAIEIDETMHSEFVGYEKLAIDSSIVAFFKEGKSVTQVEAGQRCFVVTKQSPFFIVGGGQVPDQGWITVQNVKVAILQARHIKQLIAVEIIAPVRLKIGDLLHAAVDQVWRTNAMKNHTATHLLQAALMQRFGQQIKQAGSLVHPDYLRFDFTYAGTITAQDIEAVETMVNQKIMENIPVSISYMSLKEAQQKGALAFFGDKYKPENVRVIEVPGFSVELCGGTHVRNTGDIGLCKIVETTSPAAGQKRFVAVTGPEALKLFQKTFATLKKLSVDFKVKIEEVETVIQKQKNDLKLANTSLQAAKKNLVLSKLPYWEQQLQMYENIPFFAIDLQDTEQGTMQEVMSYLVAKKDAVVCIFNTIAGKSVQFCITLSNKLHNVISLEMLASKIKQLYEVQCNSNKNMLRGGLGSSVNITAHEFMTKILKK